MLGNVITLVANGCVCVCVSSCRGVYCGLVAYTGEGGATAHTDDEPLRIVTLPPLLYKTVKYKRAMPAAVSVNAHFNTPK